MLAPSSPRWPPTPTNLFITLSGRALRPDLFIVARAREESSVEKLTRAGADRVVNPQEIGGARIAAFLLQPHVTEFLDVVMHDRSIELRLEEVTIPPDSRLAGRTLRQAHVRDETGALILAVREGDGTFLTNPDPDRELVAGQILIAIGTDDQLRLSSSRRPPPARRCPIVAMARRSAVTALQGHGATLEAVAVSPRPRRCLLSAMTSSRS